MKKKFTTIISFFCVMCLLSLFCACQTEGEDLPTDNLPSGTVVIDESTQNPQIDDNTDYSEAFIIEGTTITGLTDYGATLTQIAVPKGITEIGEHAFVMGRKLEYIELPQGVEKINALAFSGCYNLVSINIPSSVTYIEKYAFGACTSFTIKYEESEFPFEIDYGGAKVPVICNCNTNDIADDGYRYVIAENGIKYAIKDGVAKVSGHKNLYGKIDIASDIIYNGEKFKVQELGRCALLCTEITDIALPNITVIGAGAFLGCINLKNIKIPNSVSIIGESAFAMCKSLTEIEIPSGVTDIESETFNGCSSLTSVKIPTSVKNIEPLAFGECTGLTKIVIPIGVTNIEEQAFSGCDNLTIYCEVSSEPSGFYSGWNGRWNGDSPVVWGYKG